MSNYQILECELRANLKKLESKREWDEMKLKIDMDYDDRKRRYDMETELLRLKREQFYAENPDFPFKSMYMQVVGPPMKVEIKII